jgi:hypothetical protein
MGEETTVYFEDMETFLTPEEFQAFLRAKKEVDEYWQKKAAYDKGKADAEQSRDECEKERDGAKSDDERRFWDVERFKYMSRVLMLSPPYYSVHYFHEHDRCIDLVRERKKRREKRLAALKEIAPPLDDAKKYLSDHEYQQFCDSVPGAIDAYLDIKARASYHPRAWLLDDKASGYRYWILVIEGRAREKARRKQAQLEHSQFLYEINNTIKEFKKQLVKEKKPSFHYPPALANHRPDAWYKLKSPTQQEVGKWAQQYIWERVPPQLKDLVSWEVSCQVLTLPYAKYELLGVACLTWYFAVLILVKVHLRLVEKTFTKKFHGYECTVKAGADDLGVFYLGPVEWERQEGFVTPLALLAMLAKEKLEDDGIEVVEHEGTSISFCVQGYDEGLTTIDGRFREFVIDVAKDKPLAQGLLEAGIIDGLTAQLVGEKVKVPLPQLVSAGANAEKTVDGEVIAALEAMGYKKGEIKAGMDATHLSPAMSLEGKVKSVLSILGA